MQWLSRVYFKTYQGTKNLDELLGSQCMPYNKGYGSYPNDKRILIKTYLVAK